MDRDREEVKLMVRLIGARYTGYLTRSNTLLICKEPCGMKYEKAREWRIPCVNVAWLCAVMAGSTDAIQHLQHERFSLYNLLEAFSPERHLLTALLAAWKNPIQISRDALIASRNISRRKLSELSCHQATKKPRQWHIYYSLLFHIIISMFPRFTPHLAFPSDVSLCHDLLCNLFTPSFTPFCTIQMF
uniref:PAX-interacting protein 1 n=1 Tax=Eptatretus burgeri TaxID=7764 RepID=A0A8C4NFH0_EPTBU